MQYLHIQPCLAFSALQKHNGSDQVWFLDSNTAIMIIISNLIFNEKKFIKFIFMFSIQGHKASRATHCRTAHLQYTASCGKKKSSCSPVLPSLLYMIPFFKNWLYAAKEQRVVCGFFFFCVIMRMYAFAVTFLLYIWIIVCFRPTPRPQWKQ